MSASDPVLPDLHPILEKEKEDANSRLLIKAWTWVCIIQKAMNMRMQNLESKILSRVNLKLNLFWKKKQSKIIPTSFS